ncbi:HEAT repeat domain-containing protein [Gordonia caeni]
MRIGEVARHSGVSTRMLRHYDTIGLLAPSGRTSAGYREYSTGDLKRLFQVESLRSLGLSLAEIGTALDDPGFSPAVLLDRLLVRTRERIAREEELLARLGDIRDGAPAEWAQVLHLIPLIRGLQSALPARRQSSALAMTGKDAAALARALTEALLAEPEPNAAGALKWALRRAGDAAFGPLTWALGSPDARVRYRAVDALADLDTPEASTELIAALNHSDPAVRRRAALATGSRGFGDALPELLTMVIDGDRDVEAAETIGALARSRELTDEIAGTILAELDGLDDPGARLRLTQALAELPGETSAAALSRLTADADPNVARSATFLAGLAGRDG